MCVACVGSFGGVTYHPFILNIMADVHVYRHAGAQAVIQSQPGDGEIIYALRRYQA